MATTGDLSFQGQKLLNESSPTLMCSDCSPVWPHCPVEDSCVVKKTGLQLFLFLLSVDCAGLLVWAWLLVCQQ